EAVAHLNSLIHSENMLAHRFKGCGIPHLVCPLAEGITGACRFGTGKKVFERDELLGADWALRGTFNMTSTNIKPKMTGCVIVLAIFRLRSWMDWESAV